MSKRLCRGSAFIRYVPILHGISLMCSVKVLPVFGRAISHIRRRTQALLLIDNCVCGGDGLLLDVEMKVT